jgi:hypothetical protein
MGLPGWNPDTLKLFESPNGLMCEGCCPVFAPYDCCCFLNPSPPAWNDKIIYKFTECVSYNGQLWYSLQNNNINHIPAVGVWWKVYTACGNTNWDSVPPFGGIGKTPQYYVVSSMAVRLLPYGGGECTQVTTYEPIILTSDGAYGGRCTWSGSAEATIEITATGDSGCDLPVVCKRTDDIILNLRDSGYTTIKLARVGTPICSDSCICTSVFSVGIASEEASISACTIKGSGTALYGATWTSYFSWRPLDCNYMKWNSSTDYEINDCVTHVGYFFRACLPSGPSKGGAVEPSESDPTSCSGQTWRKVV